MRPILLSSVSPLFHLILAASLAVLGCVDPDPAGDDDAVGDDDDDDDTEEPEIPVTDVSWQVHDVIESLIVVSWTQLEPATAYVEFSVDEGLWGNSPALERDAGEHQELLLGCPYGSDVRLRLVNELEGQRLQSEEQIAHTGPLPEGTPVAQVLASDESRWEASMPYLLVSGNLDRGWTTIVDRQGRVVWARQTPSFNTTLYARISHDGTDLLIDHNTYWAVFDDGEGSQVLRLKIDGSEVARYDTPGLHHPFTELADGSLVWGAADGLQETVEKLTPGGVQESIWSCQAFHQQVGVTGYCQSNTLYWNQADDTFLFSLYSDETIVEIDHASGDTLRYFGHVDGAWAFDPPESAFHWQHGGHFTEAGTLITSSHSTADSDECVVREYELDAGAETLHEVWSFGVGLGVEAEIMGEVHRLPGGGTLHNYGSGARVREATPEGDVVWDLQWDEALELGRTTPLEELYALSP